MAIPFEPSIDAVSRMMRYDRWMLALSLSSRTWPRAFMLAGGVLIGAYGCGSDDRLGSGASGLSIATSVGPGSGSGGANGASTSTSNVSVGIGGSDVGPTPPEKFIPIPTNDCPDFKSGKISFDFGGDAPRDSEVWTSDDPLETGGPLVIVWHSFDGTPLDAIDILGQDVIDAVMAQGGAIVAPYPDVNAGFSVWHAILGQFADDSDMRLADEIVACAMAKKDISTRRIHSVGFGFGAMQTVQLAVWRSGYMASIVAHSTSFAGDPIEQDPDNLYAAMVIHGGAQDANMFQFDVDSPTYVGMLRGEVKSSISGQHFAVLCDHDSGHVVAEDVRNNAYQFLIAHPYATDPSPYEGGLPSGFPTYCAVAE